MPVFECISVSSGDEIIEKSTNSSHLIIENNNEADHFSNEKIGKTLLPSLSQIFTPPDYEKSTLSEKLIFLKSHPVQPTDVKIFDPRKIYYRNLPSGEKFQRKRLSYCQENETIICSVCMVFSKNRDSPFCKGLTINFKNIYIKLEKHEHSNSTLHLMRNSSKQNITDILTTQREKTVKQNREILHRIVNSILLLAKQNAAFRGTHEGIYDIKNEEKQHGNFLEIIKFLCIYDPVIASHIEKCYQLGKLAKEKREKSNKQSKGRGSLVTFLSKTTVRKIIIIMGNLIKNKIAQDVISAGMFSLEVDSTQDIGVLDQLCKCVRYVDIKNTRSKVRERFLKMVSLTSATGEAQHKIIKEELNGLNIELNCLVSQSFDGAPNMSGSYNGLQNNLKKDSPNSIFTHCHAHCLNLLLEDVIQCCFIVQDLIGIIQKTSTFFSASYKRSAIWSKKLNDNERGCDKLKKLKEIGKTRWNGADFALKNIMNPWSNEDESKINRNNYYHLLDALHTIAYSKESDPKTASEARGLIAKWTSYEYVLTAFLLLQIFSITTPLSKYLQTKGLNWISAWNMIKDTGIKLQQLSSEANYESLRKRVSVFLQKMVERTEDLENILIEEDFPVKRLKTVKKMSGENLSDCATNFSQNQKFRITVFRTIYDKVKVAMNDRFYKNEKLIKALALLDPRNFDEIFVKQKKLDDQGETIELENLKFIANLSQVDYETLKTELLHFASSYKQLKITSSLFKTDEIHEIFEKSDEYLRNAELFDSDSESVENEKPNEDEIDSTQLAEFKEDCPILHKAENESNSCSCISCVFNFLLYFNLHSDSYSTLYVAYKYVLTLACTQVNCERVFSKLKIIKNRLRSSMKQDLLESQLLLSVEKDCLPNIEVIIDEIAGSSKLFKNLLYA